MESEPWRWSWEKWTCLDPDSVRLAEYLGILDGEGARKILGGMHAALDFIQRTLRDMAISWTGRAAGMTEPLQRFV